MASRRDKVKKPQVKLGTPRGNGDALSLRPAEPGTPEYAYMHRYDSPDNRRDSMG